MSTLFSSLIVLIPDKISFQLEEETVLTKEAEPSLSAPSLGFIL